MRQTVIAAIAVCAFAANVAAQPGERLETILAEEWAWRNADNPFLQDVIESGSPEPMTVAPKDYARRLAQDEAFYDRLLAIDAARLSPADRLDYHIFEFVLRQRIEAARFKPWRMPFVSSNGFFNNIAITLTQAPRRTAAGVELYIRRIEALPAYFDQQIANMRQGLADGFSMPREIMPSIVNVVAAQVVDSVEDSPLWAPFETLPAHLSSADKTRLRQAGREAIETAAMPGYRRVLSFFQDEYVPQTRATLAAIDLPDGRAYYRHLLEFNTTIENPSPEEIHSTGLAEVARIRAEMDKIIAEVGFEGDFDAFLDFLRNDPQFYPSSADALMKEAAYIAKRIDGLLPAYFNKLPRTPYGVFPVPADIAPNYTTGRYWWPPIDRSSGGRYLVNTYALDKRPLYNLTALTLHEAVKWTPDSGPPA